MIMDVISKTPQDYDLFLDRKRELALDIEQTQRRRRLYQKFGESKRTALGQNTWSVEDHRDFLMCGFSDKQKRFCILPRAVVTAPAFWSLKNSTAKALIMAYNEVSWVKPKRVTIQARAGGSGQRRIKLPPEPQPFTLPIGRLQAVGLSRPSAITSMQELTYLGFVKILEHEAGKPTVYAISTDYQKWPSSELGGKKTLPPSRREKPVSGDSETGKLFTVAV